MMRGIRKGFCSKTKYYNNKKLYMVIHICIEPLLYVNLDTSWWRLFLCTTLELESFKKPSDREWCSQPRTQQQTWNLEVNKFVAGISRSKLKSIHKKDWVAQAISAWIWSRRHVLDVAWKFESFLLTSPSGSQQHRLHLLSRSPTCDK